MTPAPYEERDHKVAFKISEDTYHALRLAAAKSRLSASQYMSDLLEVHVSSIAASANSKDGLAPARS